MDGRWVASGSMQVIVEKSSGYVQQGTWPHLIAMWKDPATGRVRQYFVKAADQNLGVPSSKQSSQSMADFVDRAFDGYRSPLGAGNTVEVTTESKLSLFGASTSCVYYSAEGSPYNVLPGAAQGAYVPSPVVDRHTTTNFKYGIWYYNARELKDFADLSCVPVFVQYSSDGCTPCEMWAKRVYADPGFQEWVRRTPCLFCRIELRSDERWDDPVACPQPYFVDKEWIKAKGSLPFYAWYWKRPDGKVVNRWVSGHFTPGKEDPPAAVFDIPTLEASIEDEFSGYGAVSSMWPPEIRSFKLAATGTDMYRCYANQPDISSTYISSWVDA